MRESVKIIGLYRRLGSKGLGFLVFAFLVYPVSGDRGTNGYYQQEEKGERERTRKRGFTPSPNTLFTCCPRVD